MSGTIGGVNADIPLQAGQNALALQQRNNPLQMMEQFALTQNLLNQNRMFPGELALQKQQIQSGAQTLAQHIAQTGWQGMVPLLTGGPITHSRVTNQAGILEAEGYVTAPMLQAIADMPQGDGPAFDAAVRAQIAARAMTSPESAEAAVVGHPAMMSNGQFMQPGMIQGPGSQTPGAFMPEGMGVPQFPARSELAQPVHWTDPKTGQVVYGNMAEYNQLLNQGELLGPAVPGGATGGTISSAAGPPSSHPPGTLAPVVGANGQPVGPTAPARLQSPQASGPTTLEGPLPGTPQFYEGQAADYGTAVARSHQFSSDMFRLQQGLTDLEKAPTGYGSDIQHNISSLITTYGPQFLQRALSSVGVVMSKDQVAAYDEAKKYLTQSQLQVPGATRSNEGLGTAGAASPSTQISKEAAILLQKSVIGLRRMNQAEVLDFQKSGEQPGQWGEFSSQWQTTHDPRAYMFDLMTPKERSDLVHSMKGKVGDLSTPLGRFAAQVADAERNQILTPPSPGS